MTRHAILDPRDAALFAGERAIALRQGWAPAWPTGAPPTEFVRSPVASRVAELASDAGLFLFHFEHRVGLPLPTGWVPTAEPSLAEPPEWDAGVLPEPKYQSFRHDLPIGSQHPHHRAKWATHELCHGLVGFGWHPRATPFFHAMAGRLAELLPVALWYFFDEVHLGRCPDHQGGGALFRTFCQACEAAAAPTEQDARAEARIADGLAFVDRELAALARSRRLGRPLSHRWATIDLCSDGLAYARSHGARLESAAFSSFIERFGVAGGGWSEDLDTLEARVIDVTRGLLSQSAPAPLAPTAAHGRWRWTLQDVAWRLTQIASETKGEARTALEGMLDGLAEALPHTTSPAAAPADVVPAAIASALAAYRTLATEWEVPDPRDLVAVGYPLPDETLPFDQLADGLESCAPLSLLIFGTGFDAAVAAFAADDGPERRPLPLRWADWVGRHHPGPVADVVRYEATLATLPKGLSEPIDGPGTGLRIASGIQVLALGCDAVELSHLLDVGAFEGVEVNGRRELVDLDGLPAEALKTALIVGRDPEGQPMVLDVDPDTAELLSTGALDRLTAEESAALRQLGVLVPARLGELQA